MYQAYWGSRSSRRSPPPAASQLVEHSPLHAEALARLAFLVENKSQLGLLVGPAGSGKSLVLVAVCPPGARCRRGRGAGLLRGLSQRDLLLEIATQWGQPARGAPAAGRLWRLATDRLAELRLEQVPAVLVLDDADAVSGRGAGLVRAAPQAARRELTVVAAAGDAAAGARPWLKDLAELRIELPCGPRTKPATI